MLYIRISELVCLFKSVLNFGASLVVNDSKYMFKQYMYASRAKLLNKLREFGSEKLTYISIACTSSRDFSLKFTVRYVYAESDSVVRLLNRPGLFFPADAAIMAR
jgi:hypothetical protein